jgi:hypothetical protein
VDFGSFFAMSDPTLSFRKFEPSMAELAPPTTGVNGVLFKMFGKSRKFTKSRSRIFRRVLWS